MGVDLEGIGSSGRVNPFYFCHSNQLAGECPSKHGFRQASDPRMSDPEPINFRPSSHKSGDILAYRNLNLRVRNVVLIGNRFGI